MPDVYPLSAPEPRGALGWDGTHYYVVAVDDEGNLRLAPGGVNLRQFDSVWRFAGNVSGASGTLNIDTAVLGPGDLVVVTHAVCYLTAGSASLINIQIYDGTNAYTAARLGSPAVGQTLTLGQQLVIQAGDLLRFAAGSVGAGTIFYGWAVGYYVRT